MGPVGGLLHGAASLGVHRLFDEAERIGAETALGNQLARGERYPGVGHTIYQSTDPREVLLTEALNEAWAGDPRLELISGMRAALRDRIDLVTNVDFALGAMTFLMRADESAGEALFAMARIVGWVAHGMEEFNEQPIRFRPTARFVRPAPPDTFATFADADPTGG
jgi:citrate synthase